MCVCVYLVYVYIYTFFRPSPPLPLLQNMNPTRASFVVLFVPHSSRSLAKCFPPSFPLSACTFFFLPRKTVVDTLNNLTLPQKASY